MPILALASSSWTLGDDQPGAPLRAPVSARTGQLHTGLLAPGVLATYRLWISGEERHLERTPGDTYRRYRTSTHRWLGRP